MTKIAASDRQKVADLYASGMTQAAIAAEFGVVRSSVCGILKALGMPARSTSQAASERHKAMAKMYRSGSTLIEIGKEFGVTDKGVRQIMKALGIDVIDDDCAIHIFEKASARADAARTKSERREVRIRATWGMSLADYRAHVAEHGSCTKRSSPMSRYQQQRTAAHSRGIEWKFTFAEWWRVWQESGKWSERGRVTGGTHGYVMARYGDGDTPYSPSTVYICTQSQNSKDAFIVSPASTRFANKPPKPTGTGRGWTFCRGSKRNPYVAQFGGKHLGSFPTRELARAAYLAAVERSKS